MRRSTAESMRSLRCTQDRFHGRVLLRAARPQNRHRAHITARRQRPPQQRLFVAAASACEPLRAAAHTIQDEMIYRFG